MSFDGVVAGRDRSLPWSIPAICAMHRCTAWFASRHPVLVGTCLIAENGAVRVLSQGSSSTGHPTVSDLLQSLVGLKDTRSLYEVVPDDISIADPRLFVSFDRFLPWQPVQGATPSLVFNPLDVS